MLSAHSMHQIPGHDPGHSPASSPVTERYWTDSSETGLAASGKPPSLSKDRAGTWQYLTLREPGLSRKTLNTRVIRVAPVFWRQRPQIFQFCVRR